MRRPGIEPGSPAWKADILTCLLARGRRCSLDNERVSSSWMISTSNHALKVLKIGSYHTVSFKLGQSWIFAKNAQIMSSGNLPRLFCYNGSPLL